MLEGLCGFVSAGGRQVYLEVGGYVSSMLISLCEGRGVVAS